MANQLQTIVVPRKWADASKTPEGAHHLPAAVVDYVNDVQRAAIYVHHEMPPHAMQCFHTDYYLAQVNNGGHSQFVHNSKGAWNTIMTDALAGLEAIGAVAQHQILNEMLAWCEANPEEAKVQTGFNPHRAKTLDELDARFYAAEKASPITQLLVNWIWSWPALRIVEDDQYAKVIEEIANLNPLRAPRQIWQSIGKFRHQLSDPLQMYAAVVCGAVKPIAEARMELRGGYYQEIEGKQRLAFGVATEAGSRVFTYDETSVQLYPLEEHSPKAPIGNPAFGIDQLAGYKAPSAGKRMASVSISTIESFMRVASDVKAAEAIDLLLRREGLGTAAYITAWKVASNSATWILAIPHPDMHRLVVVTEPERAAILAQDGVAVASVSRNEIEQHAADAEATAVAMQQAD